LHFVLSNVALKLDWPDDVIFAFPVPCIVIEFERV
jgi:hypothetical protein